MDSEQLLVRWRFHKEEAMRIMDSIVDHEMLAEVDELEQNANLPCNDSQCQNCKYMYRRSKLVNRANGTINELKETYKCRISKDKKPWKGVYAIICVHPTCVKRGVCYFGESDNVYQRISDHRGIIDGTRTTYILPMHKHFWTHHDSNSDPLRYFRFVYFQEEGIESRLDVETRLMNEYRTLGAFGFNVKQSTLEEEKFVVSLEPPKPATSASRQQNEKKTKEKEKYSDVSAGLLIALAIKNQRTKRTNPKRGDQEASMADITSFLDATFEYSCRVHSLVEYLNMAVKHRPGGFREPYNYWFEGNLRERFPGKSPQSYAYRLSQTGIEDFNEWANSPAPDNEVKAILKPNPLFGEGESYKIDDHYNALISGELLEMSPLVKRPRL